MNLNCLTRTWIPTLLAFLLVGCGTTAKHTSYFTATHPDTKERNYFRVQVYAHTDDGESCWQTGWYSRRALDQIFSEITTNGTAPVDQMVDKYEQTLVELLTQFTEALKTNGVDVARQARTNIDELIGVARFYLSAGATAKDAAENAGKRFVYSFTADPTLIQRLVRDALESDQVSGTLSRLVLGNSPLTQKSIQLNNDLAVSAGRSETMRKKLEEIMKLALEASNNTALTDPQRLQLRDKLIILLNGTTAQAE